MEAIKPDPSLNLKTAFQEITSRKPKGLGALKFWGGVGGGASAGELCIEEGAWSLHLTPSFPRLGPIFKYPEHGSMAGVGPRRWAGPCKDVLSACGLRPAPAGGRRLPRPRGLGGTELQFLSRVGELQFLSRVGGRLPSAERDGHAKWGAGRCPGQEEGLWAESPSRKLREGAVDGAGRGAGVCRGPWTRAPHCPAEGLLCGGRPTARPVCRAESS